MLQRNFIYLRSGNLDGFNVDPWFKSFRQTQWILLDIQRPLWKAHALPWKALPFWKIYIWAMKSTMKATKSRGGLQLTALQWNWLQQLTCGITTLETIIIKALLRKDDWYSMLQQSSTHVSLCFLKKAWRRHPASQLQSWNHFCHDIPTQLSGGGKSNISSWGIPEIS